MTESELYQKHVKTILKRGGYSFQRVEHAHIPDVLTIKNGHVVWIELKVHNKKPGQVVKPDWRPGQMSWIRNYQNNGGEVVLAFWVDGRLYFLRPQPAYKTIQLDYLHVPI